MEEDTGNKVKNLADMGNSPKIYSKGSGRNRIGLCPGQGCLGCQKQKLT